MPSEKAVTDAYLRGQQLMREKAAREVEIASGKVCRCAQEALQRLARQISQTAITPLDKDGENL